MARSVYVALLLVAACATIALVQADIASAGGIVFPLDTPLTGSSNGLAFTSDGLFLYTCSNTFPTRIDRTDGSMIQGATAGCINIAVSPDGTKIFVVRTDGLTVYDVDLASPFDQSSVGGPYTLTPVITVDASNTAYLVGDSGVLYSSAIGSTSFTTITLTCPFLSSGTYDPEAIAITSDGASLAYVFADDLSGVTDGVSNNLIFVALPAGSCTKSASGGGIIAANPATPTTSIGGLTVTGTGTSVTYRLGLVDDIISITCDPSSGTCTQSINNIGTGIGGNLVTSGSWEGLARDPLNTDFWAAKADNTIVFVNGGASAFSLTDSMTDTTTSEAGAGVPSITYTITLTASPVIPTKFNLVADTAVGSADAGSLSDTSVTVAPGSTTTTFTYTPPTDSATTSAAVTATPDSASSGQLSSAAAIVDSIAFTAVVTNQVVGTAPAAVLQGDALNVVVTFASATPKPTGTALTVTVRVETTPGQYDTQPLSWADGSTLDSQTATFDTSSYSVGTHAISYVISASEDSYHFVTAADANVYVGTSVDLTPDTITFSGATATIPFTLSAAAGAAFTITPACHAPALVSGDPDVTFTTTPIAVGASDTTVTSGTFTIPDPLGAASRVFTCDLTVSGDGATLVNLVSSTATGTATFAADRTVTRTTTGGDVLSVYAGSSQVWNFQLDTVSTATLNIKVLQDNVEVPALGFSLPPNTGVAAAIPVTITFPSTVGTYAYTFQITGTEGYRYAAPAPITITTTAAPTQNLVLTPEPSNTPVEISDSLQWVVTPSIATAVDANIIITFTCTLDYTGGQSQYFTGSSTITAGQTSGSAVTIDYPDLIGASTATSTCTPSASGLGGFYIAPASLTDRVQAFTDTRAGTDEIYLTLGATNTAAPTWPIIRPPGFVLDLGAFSNDVTRAAPVTVGIKIDGVAQAQTADFPLTQPVATVVTLGSYTLPATAGTLSIDYTLASGVADSLYLHQVIGPTQIIVREKMVPTVAIVSASPVRLSLTIPQSVPFETTFTFRCAGASGNGQTTVVLPANTASINFDLANTAAFLTETLTCTIPTITGADRTDQIFDAAAFTKSVPFVAAAGSSTGRYTAVSSSTGGSTGPDGDPECEGVECGAMHAAKPAMVLLALLAVFANAVQRQ